MKYNLRTRWFVPGTTYEIQDINGSDGSTWLRISADSGLVAVFSAARQGRGVMPTERVILVLAQSATARDPRVIIDSLRFLGWEFWPANPEPLRDFLRGAFAEEAAQLEAMNIFGS